MSSKWVVKQERQLETSTTHLAQELLMNVQCSGGSRSFARDESLKDKERSGRPLEADNNQLRAIIKIDTLTTMLKLLKNSISTILWLTGI